MKTKINLMVSDSEDISEILVYKKPISFNPKYIILECKNNYNFIENVRSIFEMTCKQKLKRYIHQYGS